MDDATTGAEIVNAVLGGIADAVSDTPPNKTSATESRLLMIEAFCQQVFVFLMHHFPGAQAMPSDVPGLDNPVPVNSTQQ